MKGDESRMKKYQIFSHQNISKRTNKVFDLKKKKKKELEQRTWPKIPSFEVTYMPFAPPCSSTFFVTGMLEYFFIAC